MIRRSATLSPIMRLGLDKCHQRGYMPLSSLIRGTHSGCDPQCGASAEPAGGLANRSRADPGRTLRRIPFIDFNAVVATNMVMAIAELFRSFLVSATYLRSR
jgi:hypothetical protein